VVRNSLIGTERHLPKPLTTGYKDFKPNKEAGPLKFLINPIKKISIIRKEN